MISLQPKQRTILLAVRHGSCRVLCTLTVILSIGFGCCIDPPTAQAQEPYVQIDHYGEFNFSGNGNYLMFMLGSHVERYDLARRQFVQWLTLPQRSASLEYRIGQFVINSDGDHLAYIDSDTPEVQIINIESGDTLSTLPYPSNAVSELDEIAFAGDDERLVVLKHDQGLSIADGTSSTWNTIPTQGSEGFFAMSDSKCLFVVGASDQVISSIHCGTDAAEREAMRTFDGYLIDLSLSSDGTKLLLAVRQGPEYETVLHALDARTLTPLHTPLVVPNDKWYLDSAFLGAKPIVVYGEIDGDGIVVLDLFERSVLLSLPSAGTFPVVLSPNGQVLAHRNLLSTSSDKVDLYMLGGTFLAKTNALPPVDGEMSAPRLAAQLSNLGPVNGVAISEDGYIVAIGGDDGYVSLWDRASRRLIRGMFVDRSPKVALSQDGSRVLAGNVVGEVVSGKVLGELSYTLADDRLVAFVAGGTRTLRCDFIECVVELFPYENSIPTRLQLSNSNREYKYWAVSLAPDEAFVALALGSDGVGLMELSVGGRQRLVHVSSDSEVTSVAALGGARLIAGLSNGDVLLVDATQGKVLKTLHTRDTRIGAIIRLDEERLAVASSGVWRIGEPDEPAEIWIVSSRDLAVLQRLTWDESAGNEQQRSVTYIDAMAASADGRWLASASTSPSSRKNVSHVQLWDTANSQAAGIFGSSIQSPARQVKFYGDNGYLLVDGIRAASLWDLQEGGVGRKFRHRSSVFGYPENLLENVYAKLTRDVFVYIADEFSKSLKLWSASSGLHDVLIPDAIIDEYESIDSVSADGSQFVLTVSDDLVLLFMSEHQEHGFSARAQRIRSHDSSVIRASHVNAAADRALLLFTSGYIELLNVSLAESIWSRDVGNIGAMMLTSDQTGVVVTNYRTSKDVLVLEAETGETRLHLRQSVPVFSDVGVQGVVRSASGVLERLSLRDGSVIDSTILHGRSLDFVVSDHTGRMLLVSGEQVLLWDTASGRRIKFDASPIAAEGVSFSPDGTLLAIAEANGSVSLWDISGGPSDLRRLARLITFDDGDWAVVADDGRYDASDPADLPGLSWVMPDEPTEPVPVSIFFREYYEPGLLPRLLAGEALPPVPSIADVDRGQPRVEVSAINPGDEGHVNVTVDVSRAAATGVGDVKLFRDGRLVGLDERMGRPGSGAGRRDAWQVVFPNIALPTSGADFVEFSAYAFNADGVKSETHRLSYTLPATEPRLRRAFVIAVGVNAYENRSWDLRYAADDARASGSIIARHLEASDAFDEVHLVSLIAERDPSGVAVGSAARADLLAVLEVLAGESGDPARLATIPGAASLDKARPDDLVYLAFSGHGMSGDDGLFHLFLSDIGTGEARVVNDALLSRTLDSDLLARHLLQVDAGDFVMVIDACNAAASVEGGGFKPGPMGSRGLGQLAYDKAMRVLAASQAEAAALESDRLKHGMLTFAMLREGLEGGAADRAPEDRAVSLSEMLDYGVSRVPLLYEDLRDGTFTPQGRGHLDMFGAGEPPPSVQRPSLFDFSRGGGEVRMPILEAAD